MLDDMVRNIMVSRLEYALQANVEFVERKGIGHPGSIVDGIAEAVSCSYTGCTWTRWARYPITTWTRMESQGIGLRLGLAAGK